MPNVHVNEATNLDIWTSKSHCLEKVLSIIM